MSDILTILGAALLLLGLGWLHPALALIAIGAMMLTIARAVERLP